MPGPASAPAHAPAPAPARGPPAQLWPWHPEPEAAVKRLFNPVGGEIGGEIVAAATYWGSEPQQRSQIGRAGTFLSDALSERSASPPAAAEERGPPRLMPASSFTSSAGTSGSGRAGIGEEVVEDGFFPLLPKGVDIDGCEVEEGVRAVLKRLQPDQRMRQADEPAARRVLLEATKMGQQGPLARLAFELAAGAASARSDGADEEHGDTAALLGLALSTLPPEFPFDINQPAAGTLPAAHRSLQRVPSRLDELQLETYWQLLELPGFSQQQALFISALYPMLLNQDETHERLESLHGVKPLQMLALHMALENKLQHELRARGGVASQSSSGGTSSKGSLPSNVAAPLPFDARSLSHRAAGVELTPPKHLLKECSWFLLRAPLASGTGSSAAPVTATGATPRRRAEAVADLVTEVGNELIARWDLSRDGHLRARLVGHHALQDCEVDLVRLAFIRRDETMARFRIIDVMLVLGVAQDAPGAQADAEEVYTQCLELLDGLHRRADELEHGSSSLVARLTALRSDAPVTYVLGSASARALLASGLSAPLTPTQRSSSNSNSVYGSAASAARGPDG